MATTSDAGPVPDRDAPDRGTHHRTCFISYSRLDESVALELESDLEALGLDVWRDTQLTGGQDWWDTVLDNILRADVVIFLISSASLESVPCTRELEYATAARRHILPVRIDPAVLPRRSSPLLAALEWTDYRPGDKRSTVDLVRALGHLPPSPPVPDPPPAPPPVPLSYTTNLAALARTEEVLSRDEQFHVLGELRTGLRSPTDRAECLAILTTLRGRRDLLAAVADEIDELLARYGGETSGRPAAGARPGGRPAAGGPAPTHGPDRYAARPPTPRAGTARPGPVGAHATVAGTPGAGHARPPIAPPTVPPVPARTGAAPATPPRRRWLMVLLAVFGVAGALVVGLLVIGLLVGPDAPDPDPPGPNPPVPGPTGVAEPWTLGDDPALDELWGLCEQGDYGACAELFASSAAGSEYEAFGGSCGGGGCPALTYGDDPALDQMWDACAAGDIAQCDELYWAAEPGSEYETFGSTCGYLADPLSGGCVTAF